VCVCVRLMLCMYVFMCVCVCVCVRLMLCMYVCVCVSYMCVSVCGCVYMKLRSSRILVPLITQVNRRVFNVHFLALSDQK